MAKIVLELALIVEAKRGIDYYIEHVVDALADVDDKNQYTLFAYFFKRHAEKAARLPAPRKANFKTRYLRFPETLVRKLDHRLGFPLVEKCLLGERPDIYHVLAGGCLPHLSRPKSVVTFFDLSNETFPATGVPEPGKRIASPYTYDLATRADRLVATGPNTKRDLERFYGIAPGKIDVITTGVNEKRFRPIEDRATLDAVRARYGLPDKFLMVVGPYVPPMRANADFILRAFARIKDGAGRGCRLVFTGNRSEPLERLLALAKELGLAERVVTPGYIAIDDLAAVYRLAHAVVHPTSVEGFGYGLEVLACGTPLVTSNTPGVLEAVAGAALTVPPKDEAALTAALERVLGDERLLESLREKGLARAAQFSYRRIARQLVALYESLAPGAPSKVS